MLRIKYKDCPKWKQTLYELLACQQRRNKHCTNTFLQRTAPKSLPRKRMDLGEKKILALRSCVKECEDSGALAIASNVVAQVMYDIANQQIWYCLHKYGLCGTNMFFVGITMLYFGTNVTF